MENKIKLLNKLNKARNLSLATEFTKNKTNNHAKFKYMDLESVIPAIRKIESDLNLITIMTFGKTPVAELFDLETGESIKFEIDADMQRESMIKATQAVGANVTYLRRYFYTLIYDIIEEEVLDKELNKPQKAEPKKSQQQNKPQTTEHQPGYFYPQDETVKSGAIDKAKLNAELISNQKTIGRTKFNKIYKTLNPPPTAEELAVITGGQNSSEIENWNPIIENLEMWKETYGK